ncbi:MAG: universal stress protein [Balneolaceae bacterium]|nr:universal stress protein [Balneolaceae bacterium]
MTEEEEQQKQLTFQRILVALDTSGHSRAALEAAARLAKLSEAELKGLFVQDAEWHRLSQLPSLQEVRDLTGELQSLERNSMKKQIHLLEKRVEEMVRLISRQADVKHSMETAVGSIEEKVLEAAKDADLITIGRAGHSYSSQRKVGRTARGIIEKSDKPVLLLQRGSRLRRSIVAVYDGSESSKKGLKIARQLAEIQGGTLTILVLRNDPDAIRERDRDFEDLVGNGSLAVRVLTVDKADQYNFTKMINRLHSGLLVIPKDQPLFDAGSLDTLLNRIDCPLLLMN